MKAEPLDELIEHTLRGDGERLRSRYGAVPKAGLSSMLATSNVPVGFVATFAAKLLFVVGATFVAGSAIYLWPRPETEHPHVVTRVAAVVTSSAPHIQNSYVHAPVSFRQVLVKAASKKVEKNWLHLDGGNGQYVRTITNNHYQPPLK